MEKRTKIYNGKVITADKVIDNGTVILSGKRIEGIEQGDVDVDDAVEIDAHGLFISPGFIDIHVHGGGGHDFMDGTEEAFLAIAETHARYGTTAMAPTTLTSEKDDLLKTLDVYRRANEKNKSGAQFIGMHIEGPYFAMSQRGAQDPRYIRDPNPDEYKEILAYSSDIKRWSAAPELNGSIEFARYLKSKGVLVSMGHTDAVFEDALKGFENGYTLATHFYSCMSGVTRKNAMRYAGVIEAGYLIDEMDLEIIADGIHLPQPLLKMIVKFKDMDRIALITDSMRAAGMPPGESILGNIDNGLKVIVEDGVAKLPDRSSFAGSVATTDRLVRTMISMAGVSLRDAVRMMTSTPARIFGVADKKGSLGVGMDADIVLFNDNIEVTTTLVQGRVVYQSEQESKENSVRIY